MTFCCDVVSKYLSFASDSSDTTNVKHWACNLCFGSVVYEIQSIPHILKKPSVYLKF